MANWTDILYELQQTGGTHDLVRRKYLKELSDKTGRNTIAYYSGWLQKSTPANPNIPFSINDSDTNSFMVTVHGLERAKGLDLILHTPGGDITATEAIIDYLRSMFGKDIRAIVPQIAMSAGTIIALACKEILMGKHSSIGPVDPLIGGLQARAIWEEYYFAKTELQSAPHLGLVWNAIFSRIPMTTIVSAQHAIKMTEDMVKKNLKSCMFDGVADADKKADSIFKSLTDLNVTKTHSRHISCERAHEFGIVVKRLEDDQELQDAVMHVHHAFIHSLSSTAAFKITENQKGIAFINNTQTVLVAQPG